MRIPLLIYLGLVICIFYLGVIEVAADYPPLMCQSPGAPQLVKTLDHFVLGVHSEKAINATFDILAYRLGLPVVYPVAKFLGASTGMVTLGNVDLETQERTGLGFLPCSTNDTVTIEQIKSRGLELLYFQQLPFNKPAAFSNAFIGGLLDPNCVALPKRCPLLFTYNVFAYAQDQYRLDLMNTLVLAGGGRLGVLFGDAVVLRVHSPVNWTAFVAPLNASYQLETQQQMIYDLGGGPNLHLFVQTNASETIAALVVRVRDFPTALGVLSQMGLLGFSSSLWAQIALPGGRAILISEVPSYQLGRDPAFIAFIANQPGPPWS